MANRSRAECLALIQAFEDIYADQQTDLGGMDTLISTLEAQLVTGDHEEENIKLMDVVRVLRRAIDGVHDALMTAAAPLAKVLGRYAGAPDLNDIEGCLAYFQKKLVDDGDEFEERGFTKASSASAGGSNTGNPAILIHAIDPAYGGDVGHVETKTLTCEKAYPEAPIEGNEVFVVRGAAPGDYTYLEGGSGIGNAYQQEYGRAPQGLSAQQEVLQTGVEFSGVCGDEASGNLINDGDFENSDLNTEWTESSGTWTEDTTDECVGAQSVSTQGNGVLYQFVGARMVQLCIYGMDFIAKKTSTPTGSLTMKLKDDSTTHLTITKDISTLTTSAVKQAFGTVVLPKTADMSTLRIEFEVSSYGSSGKIVIDEATLQMLKVIDGGYAIGVSGGVTPAAKGDSWTFATTGGTTGDNMEFLNRLYKRGFESDTAATNWADN